MKNTNIRRIAAFTASILAAACLAVPMSSAFVADAASITINGISATQAHTFEVYQVFTGTLSSGNVLSDIKWGTGVTDYDGTPVTEGESVSDTIITELTGTIDARDIISKFTLSDTKACEDVTSSGESVTIDNLTDGYYIVKDVTNLDDADDANSAYIVQVAGDAIIDIKNAKPTVDKKVFDEILDADADATEGWGESADHAINESFQFKLVATIPADADLAAYDTYKLVFNDTMSAGVTFESIASVTVNGTPLEAANYTETATEAPDKAGLSWTLTIDDVKPHVSNWGTGEVKVEVIYNAHLNENAVVNTATGTDIETNNNKVYLDYSNNPDSTGTGTADGQTPEDYVWVFTYQVDNTKTDGENPLSGAGFKLYNSDSSKVATFDASNKLTGWVDATDDSNGTELFSAAGTGEFDIIGLDAGTYILKETTTPSGYNTCADTEITIKATHEENAAGTAANLDLTGSSNMNNTIVNKSGSTLPGTGGIGTTIFYVGGGALAIGAGVLLVSKKRISKK